MPHFVYQIRMNRRIVYVGATRNPKQRMDHHRSVKKLPRNATMKIVKEFESAGEAWVYEAAMIARLKPPMNVTYAGREMQIRKMGPMMSPDQARAIYHAKKYKDLSEREVIELMPGWKPFMARYHFGARKIY